MVCSRDLTESELLTVLVIGTRHLKCILPIKMLWTVGGNQSSHQNEGEHTNSSMESHPVSCPREILIIILLHITLKITKL